MEMSDSLCVCVCASPDVLGGWTKSVTVVTAKLLVQINGYVFLLYIFYLFFSISDIVCKEPPPHSTRTNSLHKLVFLKFEAVPCTHTK